MSLRAQCTQHPDRPALALCMACRTPLCQECSTTWEGIHYCSRCLGQQRQSSVVGRSLVATLAVILAATGLFWVVSHLMVVMVVFVEGLL